MRVALGSSKCMTVSGTAVILHKSADGTIKATLNKCAHFGGSFVPDLEDVGKMKCTLHGWKLDPSSMEYVTGSNPALLGMAMTQPEGVKQPLLIVSRSAEGYTLTSADGEATGGFCSIC